MMNVSCNKIIEMCEEFLQTASSCERKLVSEAAETFMKKRSRSWLGKVIGIPSKTDSERKVRQNVELSAIHIECSAWWWLENNVGSSKRRLLEDLKLATKDAKDLKFRAEVFHDLNCQEMEINSKTADRLAFIKRVFIEIS